MNWFLREGHAKIVEDRRAKSAYTRIERNNPQTSNYRMISYSQVPPVQTDDLIAAIPMTFATLLRLQKKGRPVKNAKSTREGRKSSAIAKQN